MSNYGKFFIHRNIFESDIWEKPPYFLKIWLWIIGKANFKQVKKGGQIYERGEFLTRIPNIIEAHKWVIGWRTKKLSKDQVWRVLEFLRKTERITTRKTTRGLWIKVLNYDNYQTLPHYETDNEPNTETNKGTTAGQHDKRNKEKKEYILSADADQASFSNSEEKKKDSRIPKLIDYFYDNCKEMIGFAPKISGAIAGSMLKRTLVNYTQEEIEREFIWFFDSGYYDDLGCTIQIALSDFVFNKWLASET